MTQNSVTENRERVALTGAAKVAGVIGWPIAHSKSPALHGYWLRKYGVDGAYVPFAVPLGQLEIALKGLAALGVRGVNVTIPHKEESARLCDRLTDRAKAVKAVNTLIFEEGGAIIGDNTDGFGFIENVKQGASDWRPAIGPALVLGAGGAARGIVYSLLEAGVSSIIVANRTVARAEALISDMKATADIFNSSVQAVSLEDAGSFIPDASLLVNTTSLGMKGNPPLTLDLSGMQKKAVVTDIVYAPLKTVFLEQAEQYGANIVDGLGMLLHQAAPGFRAWFDVSPVVDDDLRRHVLNQL